MFWTNGPRRNSRASMQTVGMKEGATGVQSGSESRPPQAHWRACVPFVRQGPSGRLLIDPARLVGLSARLLQEVRDAEQSDDERVHVLRRSRKQVVVVVEGDVAGVLR